MGFPALFVLGLLSVFLLTGGGSGQGGILDRGSDDLRLLVNALRLIKLQEKLEAVKEKLEAVKKAETEDKIYSDVGTRVSKLEGTGCRDNQMQCGGDVQECVSELLVCDGTEDCHNGHDEDPKYCNVSEIRAGMSFHSWYNFGDCNFGGRKYYLCRWTFLEVKQSKVFKSVLEITNQWKCDWGDDPAYFNTDTYSMVSHYHIAGRRYVEYNYGYHSECYFPEDNFDEVRCKESYGETVCVPRMIFFRDK